MNVRRKKNDYLTELLFPDIDLIYLQVEDRRTLWGSSTLKDKTAKALKFLISTVNSKQIFETKDSIRNLKEF